MSERQYDVFFSYSEGSEDFVEKLALRLYSEARLSFWFEPWHIISGKLEQAQQEDALKLSKACAVFIDAESQGELQGWQNLQMRTAIQSYAQDSPGFRVIPVLLPGTTQALRQKLPPYLRLYKPVDFGKGLDDERAFKRLLSSILNIPPIQIKGYVQAVRSQVALKPPPSGTFSQGYALVIGISNYPLVSPLPQAVLNDARDIVAAFTASTICGYPSTQVIQLIDSQATANAIRAALVDIAARTGRDDTVIIFFSGHGAHDPNDGSRQYILPYDCDTANLSQTAISGDTMTKMLHNIEADRLLVLFDSCHSGGVGDPKGLFSGMKTGLSEDYYQTLAQGKGRVVIASSRPDELSWVLPGANNSLFTSYLLDALHGHARVIGDGYLRVFDLFRHVARNVPAKANQHPILKTAGMENDFAIALTPKDKVNSLNLV